MNSSFITSRPSAVIASASLQCNSVNDIYGKANINSNNSETTVTYHLQT